MVDETDAKTSKQWLKRLLIAGVFLFLGYTVADFEAASLRATVSQQQGTLSHALAENSTLKERIAALEVQLSILSDFVQWPWLTARIRGDPYLHLFKPARVKLIRV